MPCVYSIKCKIEPYREYIGQTTYDDFQVRLNGHKSEVRNGRRRHLYNAIRKYGWDQFDVEILHEFSKEGDWKERIDQLETDEIARRNTLAPNGYNYETGGNKNKVLHEETKALMSEVRSGENHPMFGKHHSEETREMLQTVNRKPVQQWSKDGSTFIKTFESIFEASQEIGVDGRHITKVCQGDRKTTGGFHWKFVDPGHVERKNMLKFTKLQQWSFNGKMLIQEFKTLKEASDSTGIENQSISKCCKGKSRSAGGFRWTII